MGHKEIPTLNALGIPAATTGYNLFAFAAFMSALPLPFWRRVALHIDYAVLLYRQVSGILDMSTHPSVQMITTATITTRMNPMMISPRMTVHSKHPYLLLMDLMN